MIEIKVADEMDNAALAKIYYDIRLKEFVWEKEVNARSRCLTFVP